MKQYITLKNVRFHAFHGVAPQERQVGNEYIIDLKIETDFTAALEKDELDGTISYADVYERLKEEMDIPSKLLEHVGGRIVRRLFQDFPAILSIELKLGKRNPPMGADLDYAGIELYCQRD